MAIVLVMLELLVFFSLGVIFCIGFISGGVIGMMTSSKELKSWLNDDYTNDIIDTWMSVKQVARWIPGYGIGNMIGVKLGKILDETVDL